MNECHLADIFEVLFHSPERLNAYYHAASLSASCLFWFMFCCYHQPTDVGDVGREEEFNQTVNQTKQKQWAKRGYNHRDECLFCVCVCVYDWKRHWLPAVTSFYHIISYKTYPLMQVWYLSHRQPRVHFLSSPSWPYSRVGVTVHQVIRLLLASSNNLVSTHGEFWNSYICRSFISTLSDTETWRNGCTEYNDPCITKGLKYFLGGKQVPGNLLQQDILVLWKRLVFVGQVSVYKSYSGRFFSNLPKHWRRINTYNPTMKLWSWGKSSFDYTKPIPILTLVRNESKSWGNNRPKLCINSHNQTCLLIFTIFSKIKKLYSSIQFRKRPCMSVSFSGYRSTLRNHIL